MCSSDLRNMDIESLLSLEGVLGKKKKSKDKDEEGGSGSLLDFLPVSNPLVDMLVKFAQKKLEKKFSSPSDRFDEAPSEGKKKGRSPLKAAAFEFIGGYLKWKAIELSYKGIRQLIKKRQEKKAAEQ